ncbi:hypothetical protein IHE44_0007835 [Lamprotornis superbus]|uniref:DAN domain-containing protein n=1 Tax=Lamprotornis superbus TaxID=245042 RepID=A0A835TU76_9PASS|nr:hypothetical protein IHE44_0007835 [Lamprotornis superbus]
MTTPAAHSLEERGPQQGQLWLSRCRILAELAMMLWFVVGALFPALLLAAPPPINKLALFPDKSAWCEAKNITQIVGHSGCESKSIQNRYRPTLSPGLEAAGGTGGALGAVAGTRSQAQCPASVPGEGKISAFAGKSSTSLSPHPSCCLCRACLGQCFSYSVPNTFPQSTESLVHCDSCMPAQSMWEIVTLDCPGNEEIPRVDKLVEKILHCSCQACGKEPSPEGALFNVYLNAEENMAHEGPVALHYPQHQELQEPPPSSHHHHEEEGEE